MVEQTAEVTEAISAAIVAEKARILELLETHGWTHDYRSYVQEALSVIWGDEIDDPECQEYPLTCCGYCPDCCEHHEVDETPEVCDRGHCHDCEHRCLDL